MPSSSSTLQLVEEVLVRVKDQFGSDNFRRHVFQILMSVARVAIWIEAAVVLC